ncbi:MAG TPA: hypothetical protein VKD72_10015, partial [Gemmataceae bacterium]|nr:hypothetical protein [Gemmataceae bacterium]
MKRRFSSTVSFALAVVFGLGFSGIVAAGEQVPFKGSLEAEVAVTFLPFPEVIVVAEGSGNSAHLGAYTYTNKNLVDLLTNTAEGTYEFTAANGDKVFATSTSKSKPSGVPGVLFTVEIVTITGGTGRFANATGGFVVERLLNAGAG